MKPYVVTALLLISSTLAAPPASQNPSSSFVKDLEYSPFDKIDEAYPFKNDKTSVSKKDEKDRYQRFLDEVNDNNVSPNDSDSDDEDNPFSNNLGEAFISKVDDRKTAKTNNDLERFFTDQNVNNNKLPKKGLDKHLNHFNDPKFDPNKSFLIRKEEFANNNLDSLNKDDDKMKFADNKFDKTSIFKPKRGTEVNKDGKQIGSPGIEIPIKFQKPNGRRVRFEDEEIAKQEPIRPRKPIEIPVHFEKKEIAEKEPIRPRKPIQLPVHFENKKKPTEIPVKHSNVKMAPFGGQCGIIGNDQVKCPGVTCCSQWGWCGNTQDHCGAGCQSAFGNCN